MNEAAPNKADLRHTSTDTRRDKIRPSQAYFEFADLLGRLIAKRWHERQDGGRRAEQRSSGSEKLV